MPTYDVAMIGGGIVGLATARAFVERGVRRVVVVEAEPHVAAHQTGHNSGVIHSGIYYKPGSAKARNCADGRELLYRFCADHGIPHEQCGKVIVAVEERERPALAEIERRGHANGLVGLKRLSAAELREHEPHVAGIAGLFVRETGIVDYKAVARKYAELITAGGGEVRTGVRFIGMTRDGAELVLQTTAGEIRAGHLANCAGLQSDRVAKLCGVEPGVTIVPFRGEYYDLKPHAAHLCRNLIYPVPDARFPFLGVHFTRMIGGGVEAGPNAVLAFRREGYRFADVSGKDLLELAGSRGFWAMAAKYWAMGLGEMRRSLSAYSFWQSLRRLVPAIQRDDIVRSGAGVRAQALTPDGKLVDDFVIRGESRMIHVLNAPSPAATASISIGRSIAELASREWGLKG
jgi:L-2-hydroxyglutarate oxidase